MNYSIIFTEISFSLETSSLNSNQLSHHIDLESKVVSVSYGDCDGKTLL